MMLMNLGFAGSGAAAPPVVIPTIPAQSYAAIYRRTACAFAPFVLLMRVLEKYIG